MSATESPAPPAERPPVARTREAAATRFIADAFAKVGFAEADAATAARLMTRADLSGADAHGIFRLPMYVERIEAGGMAPRPEIVVNRTGPSVALVDGGNGLGHLVMNRAVDTAMEMARETGVGWVGVRRSNHAGPAALYVEGPAAAGMAAIYSVVASSNHMAPWGGAEALLGTNPIAFGIPAGNEPDVILDIATTVVSYGTVKAQLMNGRPIPEGWLVDPATGAPVVDAAGVAGSLLLPIGGYKGSGLAFALGLLAGPLNRAAFGRDVVDFNADRATETNTGHFVVVIDVARFLPLDAFRAEVDRHIADFRVAKALPGWPPVRLPGEARASRITERTRDGIPIPAPLAKVLGGLAERLGIAKLEVEVEVEG